MGQPPSLSRLPYRWQLFLAKLRLVLLGVAVFVGSRWTIADLPLDQARSPGRTRVLESSLTKRLGE